MKPMNDSNNDGNNNNNNNHNNWLGFSLSPHMKMEVTCSGPHHHDHHHQYHHQPQAAAASSSAAVPTTFYLSPSNHLSNSGICYGVGENATFHSSPLAVMPLKSDGSLCIMEALSRSQTQGILINYCKKIPHFFFLFDFRIHSLVSKVRNFVVFFRVQ